MPFTLDGAPLQSATVRLPRWGAWTADVSLVGRLERAAGARVSLAVGDLVLVGVVVAGGTFAEQSTYSLVGGAGGWQQQVPPRSHRSDAGVMLSEAARDLAADAGEQLVLEDGADRPLGLAWTRLGGLASDALEALIGESWWVAPDGSTHLGPRPVRPVAPKTLTVLDFTPASRRATVALSDDAVAQLLPGAVVTANGLPAALTVGGTTIRVVREAVAVDLLGERPPSELLPAIVAALTGRTRYRDPALYQVDQVAGSRVSLRPAGASAPALPDQLWIDQAYGLPGGSAELQPGALVVVEWEGGSGGSPRVVDYLPGVLPKKVGLDAEEEIRLGGAAAGPPAKAVLVNLALAQIRAAVNALGGTLPPLGDVSATKVLVE